MPGNWHELFPPDGPSILTDVDMLFSTEIILAGKSKGKPITTWTISCPCFRIHLPITGPISAATAFFSTRCLTKSVYWIRPKSFPGFRLIGHSPFLVFYYFSRCSPSFPGILIPFPGWQTDPIPCNFLVHKVQFHSTIFCIPGDCNSVYVWSFIFSIPFATHWFEPMRDLTPFGWVLPP